MHKQFSGLIPHRILRGVTSAPTRAGVRLSEPHHPTRLAKAKLKGHVCDISLEPHSIFLDNPQGQGGQNKIRADALQISSIKMGISYDLTKGFAEHVYYRTSLIGDD
ncbi:uncharacterized protein LAJ45_00053 [Morchella importuna]|uniref:uncharacterized protein n=1 Tax=Morchella importuna TaxID=1174673 RepID=UPI001E8EAA3F|nr:uncharacterized protein LAJ45_00053 [Morchella importuna]KAH8155044.1 hypothetical protein LAJ45_00053 [Morchella importuna]